MRGWLMVSSLILLLPLQSLASSSTHLQDPNIDIHDQESLQRGATIYFQYCIGCHSAKFMRYSRVAEDLQIPIAQVEEQFMLNTDKITDTMRAIITPEVATETFGIAAPDLTLEARYRGPDWVYTYLMSFTEDSNRPYGFNNTLFPDVAMPWVLHYHQATVSTEVFAKDMRDLTNFMTYIAEPIRPFREKIGKYVILFLFLMLIPAWLLKREYWKDIH